MQKRINKYIFSLMLAAVAVFFLFLVDLIYTLTLEDAKKNHQMQQLEMAKVVAEGTRYFLYHLVKDMEMLTSNPRFAQDNSPIFHEFINQFRKNYDQTIISSIFVFNKNSVLKYVSGKDPPKWVKPQLEYLLASLSSDSIKYSFIASEVNPETDDYYSEKSFLILLPIKNSLDYVAFLVNFDSLIKHFILPLKLSSNDFVWILDGEGRLIYHPKHKEMLFNSILEVKEECLGCHKSFDDQKKIIYSKGPSYGEYWVQGNEPSKIFANVPLQIENQRWNIAVSTLLPDVITGLKGRFQLFFILGIIILLTLLSFVFIIYYLNLRRIKSEEETKNLERIRDFQEQLNHSSKLASIGELVDSVAHELNTPMGIISAHADSILLRDNTDHSIREELEIIKKQTRRVSDYTRSILNFSKRMPFNPEEINITGLIDESIYILNPRIREKKIKVIKEYPAGAPFVWGDKRQLEQVFINIFNNAIDAAYSNGVIKIEVGERVSRKEKFFRRGNDFILIKISDNGSGIQKEDLDKIFDPFFTTKPSGTGLGLPIVRTIIQRHKGSIEAESKPGIETVFCITLPETEKVKDEKQTQNSYN